MVRALPCPWAEVVDPLQNHLLQHLPLESLAQLRATCQSFRSLVDSGTNTRPYLAKHNVLHNTILQEASIAAVSVRLHSVTGPSLLRVEPAACSSKGQHMPCHAMPA